MSRLRHWTLASALALGLAGCASAPVHYYTLTSSTPLVQNSYPTGQRPFELMPVAVPAQVDVPQLVVRTSGQSMQLLDGERWIAPLSDEIHSALAVDLGYALGVENVSGLPSNGEPRLRITVNVLRFESVPDSHTFVVADWSLRLTGQQRVLTCGTGSRVPVGAGYQALVAGYQTGLADIARAIATTARSWEAGNQPACPAD